MAIGPITVWVNLSFDGESLDSSKWIECPIYGITDENPRHEAIGFALDMTGERPEFAFTTFRRPSSHVETIQHRLAYNRGNQP